jgi:hypothetical protein
MVAPTCFGITLPSSGSVSSALWEMFNWVAVDRLLWKSVLCLSKSPQMSIYTDRCQNLHRCRSLPITVKVSTNVDLDRSLSKSPQMSISTDRCQSLHKFWSSPIAVKISTYVDLDRSLSVSTNLNLDRSLSKSPQMSKPSEYIWNFKGILQSKIAV